MFEALFCTKTLPFPNQNPEAAFQQKAGIQSDLTGVYTTQDYLLQE